VSLVSKNVEEMVDWPDPTAIISQATLMSKGSRCVMEVEETARMRGRQKKREVEGIRRWLETEKLTTPSTN